MGEAKPAMLGAVKILVDGAKDVVAALEANQSLSQKIIAFENLVPDAMAELAVFSDIPAEIKNFQPADAADLAAAIVADYGFSSPKAQAIAQSALKVIGDVASNALPDILAL